MFKNNNIRFYPTASVDSPLPSQKFFPDWYKKLPKQIGPRYNMRSIKACVPFLDAMAVGYVIPLWADLNIFVDREKDGSLKTSFEWNSDFRVYQGQIIDPNQDAFLGWHDHAQLGRSECPFGKNHQSSYPKFNNPWVIETPKGWSCFFKNHGSNIHSHLRILEGIVDTDKFFAPVNFPFIWTGQEEGKFFIPKGYPLIHVFPFKRGGLKMKIQKHSDETFKKISATHNKLASVLIDAYKRFYWHKGRGE